MLKYELVQGFSRPTGSPLVAGFAVTPNDDEFVHEDALVGLYLGGYGDIQYEDATGNVVVLKNISGFLQLGGNAIAVSKVLTATTCTDIVAFML